MQGGTYVINLDEYELIETHWVALFVNVGNGTYRHSFGVFGYIPKEIRKFIGNENIIINIYRIQAYKSIMCGYVCIRFIDFMLNAKKNFQIYFLLMSTKNGKIILKYFQ